MFFFWFQQFDIAQTLAWIMMFVILMLVLEYANTAYSRDWKAVRSRGARPRSRTAGCSLGATFTLPIM